MSWSDRKHYQKFTYANLIMCGELFGINYDDSENIKMMELVFYSNGADAHEVDESADAMSKRLNRRFANDGNTEYEVGITSDIAEENMKNILKLSNKTVRELSEQVNANYKFNDE